MRRKKVLSNLEKAIKKILKRRKKEEKEPSILEVEERARRIICGILGKEPEILDEDFMIKPKQTGKSKNNS